MSGITLAQAQAKLDALMAANESASLSVRYADRQVTYRSAGEIIDLINYTALRGEDLLANLPPDASA